MQTLSARRPLNGLLLLDKPAGITSNRALQIAKHLYRAEKAGHTGTLDPLATGLLPICFGEATKFAGGLLDAGKRYEATIKLGVTTTTGDAEGEVIERRAVDIHRDKIEAALRCQRGHIEQVPPMHSALKHEGRPLYRYAREGVAIEREARKVVIHELVLKAAHDDEIELIVHCSKGVYVRVLAEDIGRALGCGAHLLRLRRIGVGQFEVGHAMTLVGIEAMTPDQRDRCLLDEDSMLSALPSITLDAARVRDLMRGQRIAVDRPTAQGRLRVYDDCQHFLGVAENGEGVIAARRLIDAERYAFLLEQRLG